MYAELFGPHHQPHFHAYYQEFSAVFTLDTLELIAGELPLKQRRLIEAWTELHRAELGNDWKLLQTGRRPQPIAPLQ